MSYTRALLTRWSRRDRLTVVVVAVTTLFLVGTALLLFAASSQVAALEEDLGGAASIRYESSSSPYLKAGQTALPVAEVQLSDGTQGFVVGIPADAPTEVTTASVQWQSARLPQPTQTVYGPNSSSTHRTLRGEATTRTVPVESYPNATIFPSSWYAANVSTVDGLGQTGSLVLDDGTDSAAVSTSGTPLLTAVPFLLGGINHVTSILSLLAISGSVLVLIVVYNVSLMSVRERLETIRIIRATGGQRRTVVALFGLRAGILTAVGVGLGYGLGAIVTNLLVNLAIVFGFPIALNPSVSPAVLRVLTPVLIGYVLIGIVAGVIAAWPSIRGQPATVAQTPRRQQLQTTSRIPESLKPYLSLTMLNWRALIPATATLTVFALVVVLVGSLIGAAAPLSDTSGATITEAGATNPLSSQVDIRYADVLRAEGVSASPEILLAQRTDGQSFLARGANYSSFAAVSGTTLVRGRAPQTPGEAVIGNDLAQTLGVDVGDQLTLGGTISPAVTRVEVVGTFTGTGIHNDQLIVPLETAHHLSLREGNVHLIRTNGNLPESEVTGGTGVTITDVAAPETVPAGTSIDVELKVQSFETQPRTRTIAVAVGPNTVNRTLTLAGDTQREVTVTTQLASPGEYRIQAGSHSQALTVRTADSLTLETLPTTAPPNSSLFVPVRTVTGDPVRNATVTIGETTARTGPRGIARLSIPPTDGRYTVAVQTTDGRAITQGLTVSSTANKQLAATVSVSPTEASVLTRPTVTVQLGNRWDKPLTRNVTLVTPSDTTTRTVTLSPGNVTGYETTLGGGSEDRISPGTYRVRIVSDGEQLDTATYSVRGDDRIFSAVASGSQISKGSGLDRVVETVFGNINLILGGVMVLAGLMTIGGTTTTFAQVIHARRQTFGVYQATGADEESVVYTILGDVLRLSIPASVLAVALACGILALLQTLGQLVLFGIQPPLAVPVGLLGVVLIVGIELSLVSAIIAAVPLMRNSSRALLSEPDVSTDDEIEASVDQFYK
jgi:ABC-type antimicrobial peptide transport system permease subunit